MSCRFDECDDDVQARGMCNRHYLKWHYRQNQEYYKKKRKRYRDRTRRFIDRVKSFASCNRCEESRDSALQFHHPDRDVEFRIGSAADQGKSIETVKDEMRRCEVLCSNCHIVEHNGA